MINMRYVLHILHVNIYIYVVHIIYGMSVEVQLNITSRCHYELILKGYDEISSYFLLIFMYVKRDCKVLQIILSSFFPLVFFVSLCHIFFVYFITCPKQSISNQIKLNMIGHNLPPGSQVHLPGKALVYHLKNTQIQSATVSKL